jgi:alpha-glucosidase
LLVLRRAEPALAIGDYRPLGVTADVLAYERAAGGRRLAIVLNFSGHEQVFRPSRLALEGRILLSTHLDREGEQVRGSLLLRPNEGCVVAVHELPIR